MVTSGGDFLLCILRQSYVVGLRGAISAAGEKSKLQYLTITKYNTISYDTVQYSTKVQYTVNIELFSQNAKKKKKNTGKVRGVGGRGVREVIQLNLLIY